MTKELKIAGKPIEQNHPPLIIAETSGNQQQPLERALEIVETAAMIGALALDNQ